jgi:hypothetical protein
MTPTTAARQPTAQVTPTLAARAARVGPGIVPPKVLHSATPHFPKSNVARTWSGTAFMFEALIDEAGVVRDVTTIKRPRIKPPWPEVEDACRSAVLGTS